MSKTGKNNEVAMATDDHMRFISIYKSLHMNTWSFINCFVFLGGVLGFIFNIIESSTDAQYKYYLFFPFFTILVGYFAALVYRDAQLFRFPTDSPYNLLGMIIKDMTDYKKRSRDFILGMANVLVVLGFILNYSGVQPMHAVWLFAGLAINGGANAIIGRSFLPMSTQTDDKNKNK